MRIPAARPRRCFAQAPPAPAGGPPPKPLPLEVGRHANFSASKGTWISLDVSPDGRSIVFDLLGDLYTLPIAGGTATRITSGMAYDAQPRFSPDGKKVAFVSDRSGGDNVWILSLDLKDTTQLTQGNGNLHFSPRWAPDGKYIVDSRSPGLGGAAKLQMYHVDGGGGLAVLQGPPPLKGMGAAFSPDGRYIWYAGRNGDWQYNAILPQYELARYDRQTGESSRMTARYGSAFRPEVSPDGKWLVYGTRYHTETGLVIRDLASGEERWLAYPVQRDDQESRAPLDVLPGYAFMPDSTIGGGVVWRRDLADSGGRRRRGEDSLHRRREARYRTRGEVRLPGRHHRQPHRPPDPESGRLAGREAGRVHRAGPSLYRRSSLGHASAARCVGARPVPSGLVARRQVDRLRHLGRCGRRADHEGRRGRGAEGRAGGAHPHPGDVLQPRLVADRHQDRRHARHRAGLPRHRQHAGRRVRLGAGRRRGCRLDRAHRNPRCRALHLGHVPHLRLQSDGRAGLVPVGRHRREAAPPSYRRARRRRIAGARGR